MSNSSLDAEPEDVNEEMLAGELDAAVAEIAGQLEERLVVGYDHQPVSVTAEYTSTACVLRIIIANA